MQVEGREREAARSSAKCSRGEKRTLKRDVSSEEGEQSVKINIISRRFLSGSIHK